MMIKRACRRGNIKDRTPTDNVGGKNLANNGQPQINTEEAISQPITHARIKIVTKSITTLLARQQGYQRLRRSAMLDGEFFSILMLFEIAKSLIQHYKKVLATNIICDERKNEKFAFANLI